MGFPGDREAFFFGEPAREPGRCRCAPCVKPRSWLLKLRPSEWQKTLAFAAAIGVMGALATIGFRQGVLFAEQLMFGRSDGLVRIAEGLVWWQRVAVPAAGGVVAGLLLMWSRRIGAERAGG